MRRLIPILVASLWALPAAGAGPPGGGEPEPRLLLIALDAVPYAVVLRVTDPNRPEGAAFRGFTGPVPLISTFPSTTSLALGGILGPTGLEKSPGYEHRYFDRGLNHKRGGGPISYRKLRFPWRKFFDWQSEGIVGKGLKLLHLRKSAIKAIDSSLAAFAASDKKTFYVYHDITDLMGHVEGPDALEPLLRHLDAALRELHSLPGSRPFYTVLYSDHGLAGGEPLRNVRRGVKRTLRRGGWRTARRLVRPADVVFIPYGLVSSFVAFTAPGKEVALAETLAGVEGVDLCAALDADADGDGWRVVAAGGSARIRHRTAAGEELYAYLPLTGDPLGYAELLHGPRAAGGDLSETVEDEAAAIWRPDAWWFEATRKAPYPDALYRIARGFDLVENPASVLCATAEGHMYGAAYTVFGSRLSTGKLKWTHGAMARDASLGFVMSDTPDWQAPEMVRFDRALIPWAAPR